MLAGGVMSSGIGFGVGVDVCLLEILVTDYQGKYAGGRDFVFWEWFFPPAAVLYFIFKYARNTGDCESATQRMVSDLQVLPAGSQVLL